MQMTDPNDWNAHFNISPMIIFVMYLRIYVSNKNTQPGSYLKPRQIPPDPPPDDIYWALMAFPQTPIGTAVPGGGGASAKQTVKQRHYHP